jgi:hypothetical protein
MITVLVRGSIVAFPAADPRREIRALRTRLGTQAPDALVVLQGGPVVERWGYVTCAFAWRDGPAGEPALVLGEAPLHLSVGFSAHPLLLHRFPVAWLAAEPALALAPRSEVDELVERFLATCNTHAPERPVWFPGGSVFAHDLEYFQPTTTGYRGTLSLAPRQALVALADIARGAAWFPAVAVTTSAPPPGAMQWVAAHAVKRDHGGRTTVWIQCHEVLTLPASAASIRDLFWWSQRYPLSEAELEDVLVRVRRALMQVGRSGRQPEARPGDF